MSAETFDDHKVFHRESILDEVIDIVDVSAHLFTDETRLAVPDKSYLQSLLEIEIPLQHRIDHLIPYVEFTADWFTADAITKKLEISDGGWVERVAKRIGVEHKLDVSSAQSRTLYAPPALELLYEEWQWAISYRALEDKISRAKAANFIGRSEKWVHNTANQLGVFPEIVELKKGQLTYLYPKQLISELRHIILVIPPNQDWTSLSEIANTVGRGDEMVAKILQELNIEPEERWNSLVGRISLMYPPDAYEAVKTHLQQYVPAADWYSIKAIARTLGKDSQWVRPRLVSGGFQPEVRLDDSGKRVLHYPPEAIESLREEIGAIESLEEQGDFVSINKIAMLLNESKSWVQTGLAQLNLSSETRRSPKKRVVAVYPPSVLDELRRYRDEWTATAGWLGVTSLARVLGRDYEWVRPRLEKYGLEPKVMIAESGRRVPHYPPESLELLRNELIADKNARKDV